MPKTKTPNAPLAYLTLDWITARPESHDQTVYAEQRDCGTVGCFAYHAYRLNGGPAEDAFDVDGNLAVTKNPLGFVEALVVVRAEEALGITFTERLTLFHSRNTLADLRDRVRTIFGPRPEGL